MSIQTKLAACVVCRSTSRIRGQRLLFGHASRLTSAGKRERSLPDFEAAQNRRLLRSRNLKQDFCTRWGKPLLDNSLPRITDFLTCAAAPQVDQGHAAKSYRDQTE